MRRVLRIATTTLLLSTPFTIAQLRAADVSGQWTFTMLPDFRGNRAVVQCQVRQDDTRVTVRCGKGKQMIGEIHGTRITYRSPSLSGNDKEFATFSGDLKRQGRVIEGTWHLALTSGDSDGKFSATKQE